MCARSASGGAETGVVGWTRVEPGAGVSGGTRVESGAGVSGGTRVKSGAGVSGGTRVKSGASVSGRTRVKSGATDKLCLSVPLRATAPMPASRQVRLSCGAQPLPNPGLRLGIGFGGLKSGGTPTRQNKADGALVVCYTLSEGWCFDGWVALGAMATLGWPCGYRTPRHAHASVSIAPISSHVTEHYAAPDRQRPG
jgi:hypothetical protein